MFLPSKKLIPWEKKDYVITIVNFVVHFLVLSGILLGIIFINSLGNGGFIEYFKSKTNVRSMMYVVVFIIFLLTTFYIYLYHEFRDFLMRAKNIAVLFVVVELSLLLNYFTGKYVSIYARPVSFCALMILLLINKRCAIFTNFCFCILLFVIDIFTAQSIADKLPIYASLIVGSISGVLAIHLIDGVRSRIMPFTKGFILFIPILMCNLALEMYDGITSVEVVKIILFSFISGMTAPIYMMAIIPVFEALFNILTNYRLVEITDHKSKLIQKMKEDAPGTFNHSLMVATLAESCAAAIGENPLLARAAGYYHDIGKLKQPLYFTENQHGVNPHDDLTPELSTEIIRSHAKDGYDKIRKYHLPLFLADVAIEHHGTLPIQYFYVKAQKFTDGELDIANFSYPGPKPHTKIAAIIMLADGCEAAIRAQNDRSHERVESVVRNIIEDRMNNDQFTDCELTTRDIDIIRKTLEESLTGAYHERINYPKLKLVHRNEFDNNAHDNDQKENRQSRNSNSVDEDEKKSTTRRKKTADDKT